MAELSRFRIVRAPGKLALSPDEAMRYPRTNDKSRIQLEAPPPPPLTHVPAQPPSPVIRNAAQILVKPRAAALGSPELEQLRTLHRWLESRAFDIPTTDLLAKLSAWAGAGGGAAVAPAVAARQLIAAPSWYTLRAAVGDSILIQLLTHENAEDLQTLCSWMLVIGFIEAVAPLDIAGIDLLDRRKWLLDRLLFFPRPFFRPTTTLVGSGAMLARQPAFTDMVVIREEWSCFQPGEIAHIENVLRGENKTRTHVRTDETTVSTLQESETSSTTERDMQSTDRSSLQEEAQRQTELTVGVDAQVDINANYGPVQIETSLGANVGYSTQESQRRASETAREVVTRSLNRIEERVASKRASVTLNRVVETNAHIIDNTGSDGHVVGIYRWVDKVSRLQVFTYPHRFVLEFQIPEPGSFIRWLERERPPAKIHIPPPPDFNNDSGQPLQPAHITRENYMRLAAKFKAVAQRAPQAERVQVTGGGEVSIADSLPTSQDNRIEFATAASTQIDVVVPDGYKVTNVLASYAAAPLLARWRDHEIQDFGGDAPEGVYRDQLGYHEIVVGLVIAGRQVVTPGTDIRANSVLERLPDGWGYGHREAWRSGNLTLDEPTGMATSQLRAMVTVSGALRCIVSLKVTCTLESEAFQEWQLETFERFREAHATWERRYREALNADEIQRGIDIPGRSPEANKQTIRAELKRQVIEMLIGRRFDGLDLVTVPAPGATAPPLGPVSDLAGATANAPIVQFLEQAFEWSNLTYVFYPYYWATRARWPELLPIEGADPAYAEFLRSGSARVVVPARPGFETDVVAFMSHGMPWRGGPIPLPDDEERYVSVAREIQEMRGAPDEGVPGDLWEVKQPTTLVWLDNDSALPKHNDRRRLTGTPLIDLCGSPEG
jgi:hypothetical protein